MSISSAMSNALSGLGAASRQAQVVSGNIANALTPGYGRQEVQLSSSSRGGVGVDGVARRIDATILLDRRASDADLGGAGLRAAALDRMAGLMDPGGGAGSLSGRVALLQGALGQAIATPDAPAALTGVVQAARDLASMINTSSKGLADERLAADRGIAADVEALRVGLNRVDALNTAILRAGPDGNALRDQRQAIIDGIAAIVPLQEVSRGNGAVALMTAGDQMLLDSEPARLEFAPSTAIAPGAVLGAPLSGLSVNGRALDMTDPSGRMAGGTLAARFALRDAVIPQAQAQLDGFARDLMDRLADPALDPTRAPGDPGIFTDRGTSFDGQQHGLAGRIALNVALDPSQGGAAWKLRDGLGAAVPGQVGDARTIAALADALSARIGTPDDPTARDIGGRADVVLSTRAGLAATAAEAVAFSQARYDTLRVAELGGGVDTDAELQTLLLVEKAYAANARVIQAADTMLQRLLEI